jgi:predicted nucleotidyltransferase
VTGNEAVIRVVRALDALGLAHMLVGSYSYNFFGVMRATADADLVIDVNRPYLAALGDLLKPALKVDPQMQFETVTGTHKNLVTVEGSPFTLELFQLSDDDHDRERFRRRAAVELDGQRVYSATPEDIIVMKLRWVDRVARPKDRKDIEVLLEVHRDALDFDYTYAWCDRHGTRALLDEIRAGVPKI